MVRLNKLVKYAMAVCILLSLAPMASANSDKQSTNSSEAPMARVETLTTIQNFYQYFNASQLDKLYALVANNVVHEMNYGGAVAGKEAFIQFMQDSKKHYDEKVENIIMMVSEDGRHVSTKFKVKGKYLQTDVSNIPAKGQNYELTALNYFELENGKIVKAQCWYDEGDFKKQVS
jgi:steroid delta-isomerase-like uncharacterized protein